MPSSQNLSPGGCCAARPAASSARRPPRARTTRCCRPAWTPALCPAPCWRPYLARLVSPAGSHPRASCGINGTHPFNNNWPTPPFRICKLLARQRLRMDAARSCCPRTMRKAAHYRHVDTEGRTARAGRGTTHLWRRVPGSASGCGPRPASSGTLSRPKLPPAINNRHQVAHRRCCLHCHAVELLFNVPCA